jgi:4-amino-4-deoxy-L-arabinose transferase-like glycosyltransferase
MWDEGLALLYRDDHYDRTLALARLGILPFFWAACWVVYAWAKRYFGEPATTFAVLCFTFLPPVLAHAGVATTDMALTATLSGSFLTAMIWLDRPSLAHSALFGVITGLAVLSKFSTLAFLPVALAASLVWYLIAKEPSVAELFSGAKKYSLPLCGAALACLLVVWAGYRFSFGVTPFYSEGLLPQEVTAVVPQIPSFTLHLPAPELYLGIQQVMAHNSRGQAAYLLGEYSHSGWWYFYLVALAVKTPLPFFALLLCGVFRLNRPGTFLALSFSLSILAFSSFFSRINIGVRHILPVYVGFAILAGAGAARLLKLSRTSKRAGWILIGLMLWLIATSVLSHPDYLAYFNALAGTQPEKILVDSDLDWAQDLKRLAQRLHEVGAQDVAFDPFFAENLQAAGLPRVHPFDPEKPSPGWNAVFLTELKSSRFGHLGNDPELKFWPEQIKPTEKIGKGIWLWYFPPDAMPNLSTVR